MVRMPENLREERDRLWQMLDEKHSSEDVVSLEQAYTEFEIVLQKYAYDRVLNTIKNTLFQEDYNPVDFGLDMDLGKEYL